MVEIKRISLDLLKENPDNPRIINKEQYKKLIQSIKDMPEMLEARELVVNKDLVVLGGNMRYKALKELGVNEVTVKIVDWTDDKQKEFIIKDNVSGGEWNYDQLANEWVLEKLNYWGLDIPLPSDDDYYTRAINAPVYEPKQNKPPEINELVDDKKTNELINEIENSNISNEVKALLKLASYRHLVFDYSKIAEFYAHSDSDTKELFEKSALIIIDFNKAIENGYVELTKLITDIQAEDYEE